MIDKSLSIQALKKLSKMDFDDKVRLFARCRILRQNSQINGILNRIVAFESFEDIRSEIVHHLFDQNDMYYNSERYKTIFDIMKSKQNLYKKFDAYTLCAYMIYFEKFISLATNSLTIKDIRYAKVMAYNYALKFVDVNKLNANYVEPEDQKTDSMLKKEYRRSLVIYLINDLKIQNGFAFVKNYLTDSLTNDDFLQSVPVYDPYKTYANQVEEYKDANGKVYYLDSEGNLVDVNEIQDYNYKNGVMKATNNGLMCYDKNKDDEFSR